eukprot:1160911-Pelagomonas_calceolata.AAC.22
MTTWHEITGGIGIAFPLAVSTVSGVDIARDACSGMLACSRQTVALSEGIENEFCQSNASKPR